MDIALYYPWLYLTGGIERTILEIVKRSRHRWTIYTNHYEPATTFPDLAEASVVELQRVPLGRDYASALRASATIRRQRVDLSKHDALVVCSEGRGDLFVLNHHDLPVVCLCFTPLRSFYDAAYRARHLGQEATGRRGDGETGRKDRCPRPVSPSPRSPRRLLPSGRWLRRAAFLGMEALFKALDRRAWRHYRHVFCISEEVRQRVIAGKLYPAERLEVLYPGVDCDAHLPGDDREPYFLLPGRINWTKNLELGIEAFRRFHHSGGEPFRLVIAGAADAKSRDYLATLEAMAAGINASGAAIEFVLSPSEEALRRLYQRCYAVLFTALNEDWGLVPLEAMAHARPVVAVDRGGPRESVVPACWDRVPPQAPSLRRGGCSTETGLLVEPDAEAFADALRALVAAPERAQQMGRNGRERARRFSWSAYVERIDDYLEMRASRGAPCAVRSARPD